MSIGEYRGVDGVARKIVKEYRGVDGISRKVTTAYRGVNGVARKYFDPDSNKWQFFTHQLPAHNYPSAYVTVYDWFSGWENSAIVMRIDAQATHNDGAFAFAGTDLYEDFSTGGTLKITLESSIDPNYVDKVISFQRLVNGVYEAILDQVLPSKYGDGVYSYAIPKGTTKISFYLSHHSTTRSAEYFIIKGLEINGKTFI